MKLNNSMLRANEFLRRLNGIPITKLNEESQRDLVRIFYKKIRTSGNPKCLVEIAPKENVYNVFIKLYETSRKLVQNDPRQYLFQNLSKLHRLLQSSSLEFIEDLEERICIQLESTDDEELDNLYQHIKNPDSFQPANYSPF